MGKITIVLVVPQKGPRLNILRYARNKVKTHNLHLKLVDTRYYQGIGRLDLLEASTTNTHAPSIAHDSLF